MTKTIDFPVHLKNIKKILKDLRTQGIASGYMPGSCCWSCTGSAALRRWEKKDTLAVMWWENALQNQVDLGFVTFKCKSGPRTGMLESHFKTVKKAFNDAGFRVTQKFGRQYITVWTWDVPESYGVKDD